MNEHDPIEAKLERLSETVSLRASEKDLHRQNLMAFMEKNRKPVRSPYAWLMTPGARFVTAFALILLVSGGGAASAETSRPGDPLYILKLKVTEPTRSLLTFDPEEKTAFEVERTDRRLKEFAAYSTTENPDEETVALIASSLSDSIDDISENVTEFAANGDADLALKANADLQSVLTAHGQVIDLIGDRNPAAADEADTISASIDAGIADTENAENTIEDALAPSLEDDTSVSDQAAETEAALEAIHTQVTDESLLDTVDRTEVDAVLAEIEEIMTEARAARANGDRESAFLLFTEAGQRLTELDTFIEADYSLGIGIIDADNRE